jgi:hypothetical protein
MGRRSEALREYTVPGGMIDGEETAAGTVVKTSDRKLELAACSPINCERKP